MWGQARAGGLRSDGRHGLDRKGPPMRQTTPAVLLALATATAASCARSAGPTDWPTRPVKVIVPFGAGSGVDLVTRLLAPGLSERWGQPVVMDNRPGADGIVGVQAFVSANDLHTLLFTPAGQITLSPLLHDRIALRSGTRPRSSCGGRQSLHRDCGREERSRWHLCRISRSWRGSNRTGICGRPFPACRRSSSEPFSSSRRCA